MQPVAFCTRCRGMRVGLNARYLIHCLRCKQWVSQSSKLLILTLLLSILVFSLQTPSAFVFSDLNPDQAQDSAAQASAVSPSDPAVAAIETFLEKYGVKSAHRSRLATAVIASSRKYDINPRLVASIMVVESRGDAFAISEKDSIGIMQIHLPTWGPTADEEGINLFKIEDNVDLGVRILKDYVKRHGMWQGVKRYKGWNDNAVSSRNADEYVQRVQDLYTYEQPKAAAVLQ